MDNKGTLMVDDLDPASDCPDDAEPDLAAGDLHVHSHCSFTPLRMSTSNKGDRTTAHNHNKQTGRCDVQNKIEKVVRGKGILSS